ncbi:MAG: DUF5050 domain-containing protein [Oscillospiraceae bacterium]|nr:DUF5050 domain-containing protein [Oscillospiraceae bacterium]
MKKVVSLVLTVCLSAFIFIIPSSAEQPPFVDMTEFIIVDFKDGWFYYRVLEEENTLYRKRPDDSWSMIVADDVSRYSSFHISGDWIYYNSVSDYKLYKIRTNGSDKTKLSDEEWLFVMEESGDWLYCRESSSGGTGFSKMRKDGTEYTKFTDDDYDLIEFIDVVDDWIYYYAVRYEYEGAITEYESNVLYKMRTDGTEVTELCDKTDRYIKAIIDDWVYYIKFTISSGMNLHRMSLDGTNDTLLAEEILQDFLIDKDWIYYQQLFYPRKGVNKIRLDGTEKTNLGFAALSPLNIFIQDDWIYSCYYSLDYSTGRYDNHLGKIRTDGSELTDLSDNANHIYAVEDNWIYYQEDSIDVIDDRGYDYHYPGKIYKIKTDGTKKTEIVFPLTLVQEDTYNNNQETNPKTGVADSAVQTVLFGLSGFVLCMTFVIRKRFSM